MSDPIRVEIADDAWQPAEANAEDPTAYMYLRGSLTLAGLPMHVTAMAVAYDDDLIQRAVTDDEQLADLHAAFRADGSFMTTKIAGRDYVLFAEPHS